MHTRFQMGAAALILGMALVGGVALGQEAKEAKDSAAPAPKPTVLAIERQTRSTPVDFYQELIPVLQASCLPCHNRTTTKADLILETPADILRGGESGPAAVPGKSAESLMLRVSTHELKPRMPPKDNKANAANLTARELGLLAMWIDEGCKESERKAAVIRWEAPSDRFQPVYAVAMAADAHVAVAGRGPRLALLDPLEGTVRGWLSDSGVSTNPVSAHRDLVNSVAVSPDGTWIASGGYREIKVWKRTFAAVGGAQKGSVGPGGFAGGTSSTNGSRVLRFTTNGAPELVDEKGGLVARLHPGPRLPEQDPTRQRRLAQSSVDAEKGRLEAQEKELAAQSDRLKKAREAELAARKARDEKTVAADRARMAQSIAEAVLARAESAGATTNATKALKEKVEAARKAVEPAAAEATKAQTRLDTAGEELRLADLSRDRAAALVQVTRTALQEAQVRQASMPGEASPDRTWGKVIAGAWSPSGKQVALLADGQVHVWASGSGSWVASTRMESAWDDVGFAGEDTLQLSKGAVREAWDFTPTYKLVATLGSGGDDSPIADRVNALAFRSDGLRLACGSGEPTRGGEVRVWDPATGRHLYGFTNVHSDAVLALAWSPDGQRIATGGADRFARVIEVANGRVSSSLEGHSGHVLAVSWRADGRVLATGGADGAVKFWTLGSADKAKNVPGFAKEIVGLCHIGAGGDAVVVPGETDFVRLTESGEKPATLGGAKEFQHAAAISYDGRWLLAGGQDGVIRAWDVEGKKLLRELGR